MLKQRLFEVNLVNFTKLRFHMNFYDKKQMLLVILNSLVLIIVIIVFSNNLWGILLSRKTPNFSIRWKNITAQYS